MTDQRYTGPDGAKRLELLEELASAVITYSEKEEGLIWWAAVIGIGRALDRDNGRLDRLEKEAVAFREKQGTRPRRLIELPEE